jgi:hypothetical protein
MDWFLLLAPIALLLILVPLGFIGCGLEESGLATCTRPVQVHFAGFIPKRPNPVVQITAVIFAAYNGQEVQLPDTKTVTYGSDGKSEGGPLRVCLPFVKGEAITVRCDVILKLEKPQPGWPTFQAEMKTPTTSTTIGIHVQYEPWAGVETDQSPYDPTNLHVSFTLS